MRPVLAEFLGSAGLLIAVVGSGIMAEALADGNVALALLANAIATGCALFVLITVLGPISGAHFNPAVTLAFRWYGDISTGQSIRYVAAQITGGLVGVAIAHLMFDLSILQISGKARTGLGQWSAEIVATFGLVFFIFGGLKSAPEKVPAIVALYITGAYWFTASTSFANPAVTIARSFSDTFAGIHPGDAPLFVLCQICAVLLAVPTAKYFFDQK